MCLSRSWANVNSSRACCRPALSVCLPAFSSPTTAWFALVTVFLNIVHAFFTSLEVLHVLHSHTRGLASSRTYDSQFCENLTWLAAEFIISLAILAKRGCRPAYCGNCLIRMAIPNTGCKLTNILICIDITVLFASAFAGCVVATSCMPADHSTAHVLIAASTVKTIRGMMTTAGKWNIVSTERWSL